MPFEFTKPISVSKVENAPPALIWDLGLGAWDLIFLKTLSSIFILSDIVRFAVSEKWVLKSKYFEGSGRESKNFNGFDCFAMLIAFFKHCLKSSLRRELVDAIP